MRLRRLRNIAAVALLAACGCGDAIKNGRVTRKTFAHSHMEIKKEYNDILRTYVMTTVYHPDQWTITFSKRGEDGKLQSQTVEVPASVFVSVNEGDWFDTGMVPK